MPVARSLRLCTAFGFFLVGAGSAIANDNGCNFRTIEHREQLLELSNVSSIAIEVGNYRKWTINSLGILTDRSTIIRDKNKSKFKAKVSVNYPFGRCVFPAKIRQQGDWKDHITFANGQIHQSLHVELKQGNIAGIVAFKLLLPATRNGDSEIFTTQLMRAYGFFAPRTVAVPSSFNDGPPQPMLFQESIEKEMIEAHGRRESALFEGDERFLWQYRRQGKEDPEGITLARVSNSKWAVAGASSAKITSRQFGSLQKAYIREKLGDGIFESRHLAGDNPVSVRKMALFELLLLAMGGNHALYTHNRRFYGNSFEQSLEPVYYDGDIDLKNSVDQFSGDPDYSKFVAIWHRQYGDVASQVLADLVEPGIEQIARQIDPKLFWEKASARNIKDTVGHVISNARHVVERPPLDQQHSLLADTGSGSNYLDTYIAEIPRKHDHVSVATRLRTGDGAGSGALVDICTQAACERQRLNGEQFKALLSGRLRLSGRDIVFVPPEDGDKNSVAETAIPELDTRITHSPGVTITHDPETNRLTITQGLPGDWALVTNAALDGTQINFVGRGVVDDNKGSQRFNEFGLTGCLNIYRGTFSRVRISVENASCEDALNIVSSSGSIEEISIDGAAADALDVDFSTLEIMQANIANAGNDCLDFSYGDYTVNAANLSACGDKGVSVGEASAAHLGRISIDGAAIGISSKDSSFAEVADLASSEVPLCAEAFKKKQEFNGAILTIAEMDCKGQVNFDDNSRVDIRRGPHELSN